MRVEALQLTATNMAEAAELSGALLEWSRRYDAFVLLLESPNGGRKTVAREGMWLVSNGKGWVAMTELNFKRKFELANEKGERVPPYEMAPPYDR